jgi:hypothetical protein
MKRTFLFLTLSLSYIMMNAQKIDTTLLYGKWDLYYVQSPELTLCRDSLTQYIDSIVQRAAKDTGPRTKAFSDDSVKLDKLFRGWFTVMFKTCLKFDKIGNETVLTYKEGGSGERTGPYKWIARNKISYERKGGANTEIWTIISLTATKLVLRFHEDKASGTVDEMTFTRAK